MSGLATPVMDPNAIIPSPPSSVCSSTSNDTLRSATTSPTTETILPEASKTSSSATQLPFPEVRRIMGYAQEELEAISFTILENSDPDLLMAKDIDCAEGLELNWACRQLPPHCPASMGYNLLDWIPDIRHSFVHRHRFTALAACKTIYEAAVFANTMGYEALGHRLEDIATEMDWCRVEMDKESTGSAKDEPEELKKRITGRLQGVLKAARKETEWEVKDGWKIGAEVLGYTFDRKLEDNSWADPRTWGQDRNRKYQDSSSSRSRSPPARLSSVVDKVDSWRSSTPSCVSSRDSPPGDLASSSSDKPSAPNSLSSSPTRLSPGADEGDFWRSSKSGKSASNSPERPTAQNNSKSPSTWLSSSVDKAEAWRPSTSVSGGSSSVYSTPSKSAPNSSDNSPAQKTSKAYVPPAKRAGSGSSWTRKR